MNDQKIEKQIILSSGMIFVPKTGYFTLALGAILEEGKTYGIKLFEIPKLETPPLGS